MTSNNNDIGYFHQNIFKYIKNCRVPLKGKDGGWDVILEDDHNILLEDGSKESRVYVEMKNKHNTMNSASSGKTFIKMQNQLLNDDDCACFLVEAIAKKSQNIKWQPKVYGKNMGHKYIRRVSLDKFYYLVTGEEDAFYKLCMVLPDILKKALNKMEEDEIPQDTVFEELLLKAEQMENIEDFDLSIAMSIYLLGFPSYLGFKKNG
ncbi:Eco47II family restriction endonuclease [Streptococcus parauberis]|nr:Eco47II family restriction endonuclease [Streptococcus parauberis]WEM64125.1 Eco47II family restriction endonuclease [Streptococcus parauberis]